MALATSVSGTGILVDSASDSRVWHLFGIYFKTKFTETKTRTVREWVALTESAATTWRDAEKAAGETRQIMEDNRIVKSYKAISTIETTVVTKEREEYT
jgi:hypothetical protein